MIRFPSTILFFFNDTATTEIYTLSLHDALPILKRAFGGSTLGLVLHAPSATSATTRELEQIRRLLDKRRSEEHTSELQSRLHLVCRLLLEKKKASCHRCSTSRNDWKWHTACIPS